MSNLIGTFRFGCPMWFHTYWQYHLFAGKVSANRHLQAYSTLFNSVEGNTSFYQLPSAEQIHSWLEQVDHTFRFTFKFPKEVSHQACITDSPERLDLAIERFALMGDRLGCVMLQLPAAFGVARLDELARFFEFLPRDLRYGVEVRNLAFFAKSEHEKQFNQLLQQHGINRVIMDTRGLFACKDTESDLVKDVQSKKPRVPTNVIATGQMPIVRFVGHPDLQQNIPFLQPWVRKVHQWLHDGLSPYFFFHMPDNAYAPWLAELFLQYYKQSYPADLMPTLSLSKPSAEQLSIF